jgi:hypothetical protein
MTNRATAEELEAKANALLDKYVPLAEEIFADVAARFK